MGMYTELVMATELKPDTPQEIVSVLNAMCNGDQFEGELPEHPLFQTDRWSIVLACDSYSFPGTTHSTIRWDGIGQTHYLTIRTNLKNYGGEIEKLIDWLRPYMSEADGTFLGYSRYEEADHPTLIYK